ncbi:MAG: FIST N-terminal domain-containing protein [Acidimicrobiales bacterium]
MPFAAALSEHPLATQAVGEVVGQVLEALGTPPDVAMLFVTAPHAGAMEDIARAVRRLVNPRVLVGATAVSVVGGSQEVEETPGIVLWAGRFDIDVEPVRLEAIPTAESLFVAGGGVLNRNEGTLLLVADPFSFPVEQVLEHLRESAPDVTIIGGMASAARGAGGNVLVLDDEMFRSGAVGVWLPPEVDVRSVVSQGCRPIGQPFIVTRAERNVIYELAGQEALTRLNETIDGLSDHDKRLLANGLHIGHVIDERAADFGRGDFLIRGVIGADRKVGALAIGEEIAVGSTVQFQVRDAASADEDLHALVDGRRADGALVFTCNGRGSHLFGAPGHDAEVVSEETGAAVAGMFCAGEFGPVGDVNFVHGFTASIALFGERR